MSDPEVPDGIVRTRAGGMAWREPAEEEPPMRQLDRLLHELDELDPTRGRDAIKRRVAWKINRILELAAKQNLDYAIQQAIIDALDERLDEWDVETRLEVMRHFRELQPTCRGTGEQN